MPDPTLGPPEVQVGGYLPFVDIPCERFIGETIGWVIFLSTTGPVFCDKFPWLCCPIPFEFSDPDAISADIECETKGAYFGASIFWTMQAFAIWGLVAAAVQSVACVYGITPSDSQAFNEFNELSLNITNLNPVQALQLILDQRIPEILSNFEFNFLPFLKDADEVSFDAKNKFKENSKNTPYFNSKSRPYLNEIETKRSNPQHKVVEKEVKNSVFESETKNFSKNFKRKGNYFENNGNFLNKVKMYSEKNFGVKNNSTLKRIKRHSSSLDIPVPILRPIYRGGDDAADGCERDEIFLPEYAECHQILSQGPCTDDEFVVMHPKTRKGICTARLCSPDRVFVFGTQQCHDPYDHNICPRGRRLFTSLYGTPVCGCPYGTYEDDYDLDENSCKRILTNDKNCKQGEVFWFRSFNQEPECLPDPCHGLNSVRKRDEPPYIPAIFDGKCYQLGQVLRQCPEDTLFTLSFEKLAGVCATLEQSGFTVLDDEIINLFSSLYGTRISLQDSTSRIRNVNILKEKINSGVHREEFTNDLDFGNNFVSDFSKNVGSSNSRFSFEKTGLDSNKEFQNSRNSENFISKNRFEPQKLPDFSEILGIKAKSHNHRSEVSGNHFQNALWPSDNFNFQIIPLNPKYFSSLLSQNLSPKIHSLSNVNENSRRKNHKFKINEKRKTNNLNINEENGEDIDEDSKEIEETLEHRRKKRFITSCAPSNIFEPAFAACRAGSARGINYKCLPRHMPASVVRITRDVSRFQPPRTPTPSCPKNKVYSIRRRCTSKNKMRKEIYARGL